MVVDIDTGSIAPPQPQVESTVDVRGLSESEFEDYINGLLAKCGEGARSSDTGVASLVAVWVISEVARECEDEALVNVKELTREDFASPKALSQLLYRNIHKR